MAHNHAQVVKFSTEWSADGDKDSVLVAVIGRNRHTDDGEFVAAVEVDGKDFLSVKEAVSLMTGIASADSRY